jgi:uncharacterized membrane protein (DUF441 family)
MKGEDYFIKSAKYMIAIGLLLIIIAFSIEKTIPLLVFKTLFFGFCVLIILIFLGIIIGEVKNPFIKI